jgi:hypothetical protein
MRAGGFAYRGEAKCMGSEKLIEAQREDYEGQGSWIGSQAA